MRTITWTPRGFTWCCNHDTLLTSSRSWVAVWESCGSNTPASNAIGKNMHNAMDVLPHERAELFRKAAGTALHIAIARPSVQFAMHAIMSSTSTPTVMHWAKLHRPARYMLHFAEGALGLRVPAHTGNAGSTDGHRLGCRHRNTEVCVIQDRTTWRTLVGLQCRQATLVALSSGDNEFYPIVRATACGWHPDTPAALPDWCTSASRHPVR